MNWDAIGALAELIGAFAVVLTLLYLVVQVRDSAKANTLVAVQALREMRIQMFYSDRDSPYLPAIQAKLSAGEELSPEERIRHQSHLSAQWGSVYAEWAQRDIGLIGQYTTGFVTADLLLQNPHAMAWWDAVGTAIYPRAFAEFIGDRRTKGNA